MPSGLWRAAVLVAATATIASAQRGSAGDSTVATVDSVTAFSIKSGRLALSSATKPGPVYMPDGAYINESGTTIVFVDGIIVRVQRSSGSITEIGSMRMNRQKMITLTPSTNALMAVSEMNLPSGTFTSEDGQSSVTVMSGQPIRFSLRGKAEKSGQ